MTIRPTQILVLLILPLTATAAQSCVATAGTFYEFQVDRPATYVGDTTLVPHPVEGLATRSQTSVLVQLVVDTLGRPVPSSLRILGRGDSAIVARLNAVWERWRFAPAISRGCRVSQLIQIPVVDTVKP
jgi:hypothetical protein